MRAIGQVCDNFEQLSDATFRELLRRATPHPDLAGVTATAVPAQSTHRIGRAPWRNPPTVTAVSVFGGCRMPRLSCAKACEALASAIDG
jgi:hypothetical protein